jgi:hypothetical protein
VLIPAHIASSSATTCFIFCGHQQHIGLCAVWLPSYSQSNWSSWPLPTCVPFLHLMNKKKDRLCGLVVRVPRYRSRGSGIDSQRYQMFWKIVGLERGPLSLVRITEEIFKWETAAPGLENRD